VDSRVEGKNDAPPTGEIHYGTGRVNYTGGVDTLTFCDSHDNAGCHGTTDTHLRVPNQPIGMSTEQTTYPFSMLPFDGILGLAPSVSEGSVLHQIRAAKSLSKNLLGVYLSEDTHRNGSLDFGGVEPAHIAPASPLHWHRTMRDNEWVVKMKDIIVNGEPLHICDRRPGGVCPAVVDTGSSLITGPTGEVEKLLERIHTDESCKGTDQMPVVSVQVEDQNGNQVSYPLTPKEYTLRTLEEVQNTGDFPYYKEFPVLGGSKEAKAPQVRPVCDPGFGVMDVPGRKWVLGDTFLRRYYSIFDDDRQLVGLVRSIHPNETAPSEGRETPVSAVAEAPTATAVSAAAPAWTKATTAMATPLETTASRASASSPPGPSSTPTLAQEKLAVLPAIASILTPLAQQLSRENGRHRCRVASDLRGRWNAAGRRCERQRWKHFL